jgi:hypothetical protein
MPRATVKASQGGRNLYRQRWAVQVGQEVSATEKGVLSAASPINVIQRFNGGMVYTVGEEAYVLAEHMFAGRPFLFVFAMSFKNRKMLQSPEFTGLPHEVLRSARMASEQAVKGIKLAENLHNVEVDVTGFVAARLKLPKGWSIAKSIMKVDIRRIPDRACDCDVDGPCGYCCDTCDCNSCYLCC